MHRPEIQLARKDPAFYRFLLTGIGVIRQRGCEMKLGRGTWIFVLGCGVATLSASVRADDLIAQAKALKLISESATDICSSIAAEGRSQTTELSGDVKAKLAGIVTKVADLGLEGAGKYTSSEYKNVLHQDLAKSLQSNADCKLSVFKLLQEKMIVSSAPATGSSQRP